MTLAEKVGLEPGGKAKDEFDGSFLGRVIALATLLAKRAVAYLIPLAALYGIALWLFGKDLVFLMDEARPWPQLVLVVLPILIVGIPLTFQIAERRRRKRLESLAVSADQYKPGYFRLEPFEEADATSFSRADRAHERVLDWLADARSPTFRYLTGASGAGKTSLLQAFVLPRLRRKDWVVVSLRAREDGTARLVEVLREEGVIWRSPPAATEPRELLERATAALRRGGKHLLVVVDQFEELYILESEAELGRVDRETAAGNAEARERFVTLLRDLAERPIEGLLVLLSMRKDYEDLVVERYGLPGRSDENRRSVELFDVPAAVAFLRGSGTKVADDVLRRILEGAGRVEGGEGLYRPVLLNLVGLQLVRSQGSLPCPPDRIISHYLLSSLKRQNLRDVARPLLAPLVSDQGTALARPLDQLARASGRTYREVKGMLRALREDGLVRPLDDTEETWQIAHDFLARQIGLLLGRLQRPLWQKVALWSAPVLFASLVGFLWALPWWNKVKAHGELRRIGASVAEAEGGITISCHVFELEYVVKPAQVVRATSLYVFYTFDINSLSLDDIDVNIEPLRELTALTSLELSGDFENVLEPLSSLTALKSLRLSVPHLTDIEPLRGLTALTSLNLSQTSVADIEPLKGLTALTSLNLSHTPVADIVPLNGLTALGLLDLSQTSVTDIEPLRGLTVLTNLDLSGSPVDIETLKGLTTLHSLDLSSTHVTNIEPLSELTTLHSLDLSSTPVADLEPLKELTTLDSLDISSTSVTDLAPLRASSSLRAVNLRETSVTNFEPLSKLSLQVLCINEGVTVNLGASDVLVIYETGHPILCPGYEI